MDLLNGMLQKDQDEFRRICNKLINVCFICRQNQATRSDFYFIEKYKEKFEELLGVLGYRLEMNDEYGVVQLTNALNTNRQNLKLYESVIKCTLCQGHYDFSFSDFYFIFVCCVEASK